MNCDDFFKSTKMQTQKKQIKFVILNLNFDVDIDAQIRLFKL